jgi:hypothetical protein
MNPLPRETLAELVQTYGPELLDDARRVRALLYDTCPGDRREVGVLVAAVEEGIPLSISRASESISVPGELDRLTTELEDTRGLSYDAARWAVRSWAWVLGMADPPVDQEGAATREPPSEPSAPPAVSPVPPATPVPATVPISGRADGDAVTRRLPPSPSGPGGSPRRRPRRPLVLAAIAAVLLVPAVLVPVAVATSRRKPPPPATTLNGPTAAPTTVASARKASTPNASPPKAPAGGTTQSSRTNRTTSTKPPADPVRFGHVETAGRLNHTSISDDRRALTTTFSDFEVTVDPTSEPEATKTFTMTMPLTDGAAGETLFVHASGYAFFDGGAKGSVTLQGDGQKIIQGYATPTDEEFVQTLELPARPGVTYKLTFAIDIDQSADNEGTGYLNIAAIDIGIR